MARSVSVCFRRVVGLLAACGLLYPAPSSAQSVETRQEAQRNLREYLFLDAQAGFRSRGIVYAEDATPGPGARSELTFFLNARAQSAPRGALGAYLGLGGVGRLSPGDGVADPLADPRDDFTFANNARLYGAHLEYAARGERGEPVFAVRAGRLNELDRRAHLLLYDGLWASLRAGEHVSFIAYGGRRAILDGNFADGRQDAFAQIVGGASLVAQLGEVRVSAGHRVEEVQRPHAELTWTPNDLFALGVGAELIFGGGDALAADPSRGSATDAPLTAALHLDASYRSPSGRTGVWVDADLQLGRDPRPYGRGGAGPSTDELELATRTAFSASRLDRLFFGPEQAHAFAELGLEHWLFTWLALNGGAWVRAPLGREDVTSLRPRVLEVWGGPELLLPAGHRVGAQARGAFEDPGTPGSVFARAGDGERSWGSLRAYGEARIGFAEAWMVSLRPEGEAFVWRTRGPLSSAVEQVGFVAGLAAALRTPSDLRLAARYAASALPDYGSDGVELVHDFEVIVGGAY